MTTPLAALMANLLQKEHNYKIGTSSEAMRQTLTLPQQRCLETSDPFLSSLTTSRTARKARQERLFGPSYASRPVEFNFVKGREPEYGSFSSYVSDLNRNKDAALHR
jgi:hypothetical protein